MTIELLKSLDGKKRCFGGTKGKELYAKYHDEEWGVPVFDDRLLFEMLILEGAQAGLSWETILNKRIGYKEVFYNFDVTMISKMSDSELQDLMNNAKIVRNKLKIFSVRKNAKIFIDIQKEFSSFSNYIWGFVNNEPIKNHFKNFYEIPLKTKISDEISKDLKKRGMNFVGSTIIYAYMQAIGMTIDHVQECWKY